MAWAGTWIGLGYFLSHAVTETVTRLGIRVIVFFLAAFAFYLPFQRVRHHRVIRLFRQVHIRPGDLNAWLEMAIPARLTDSCANVRGREAAHPDGHLNGMERTAMSERSQRSGRSRI
jgi:hypothetical protein